MSDPIDLARAQADVGYFAEALIGEELWSHQLQFARSVARIRAACCGRQSGKSRTLAVIALHDAFSGPGRLVLVISATDDAAKRLLAEISQLASSPLLAGSVVDESKSTLILTNGSRIVSVPASERQVRGWSADLLIIDEACFVGEDVWKAARFTTIARGGRIVLASTPWGRRDRFFSVAYEQGLAGAVGFESFTWPSTASPLVSEVVLGEWRPSMTDREYRAEILAEWVEDAGAYFSAVELERAVAGFEVIDLADAEGRDAVGGIDWAMANDSSTLVVICHSGGQSRSGEPVWSVPYVLEQPGGTGGTYTGFIDLVVGVAGAFTFRSLASEANGVGAMPSEVLARRMIEAGHGDVVATVFTTSRSKELGFGFLKLLMQDDRLRLPVHPPLLRQLAALEFETLDSGSVRIAVPERMGHDDLAVGLMLAATQLAASEMASATVEYVDLEDFDPDARVRISEF